MARTLTGILDD